MKILPFFLFGFLVGAQSFTIQHPVVNTYSGPIQGSIESILGDFLQVFLGIPYAEPPLGSQRFLKPKPVKAWTKTLKATNLPPACMQYPVAWRDQKQVESEDCLYLNIYAPIHAKNGSNLPVMFWIHGGAWLLGSSRMDIYNGSVIALQGDVIVVTFNYRLTVFGFLTSNTTDAPGNIGMYDMLMALQWVNENIASFGGDNEQITLAGESAGSISISLFCVSPLTKGLFSKAILESGTTIVLTTNQLESNLNLSQQVAEVLGCADDNRTIMSDPASVVGCLRNQNASSLAHALMSINPTTPIILWPQFGDDLFPSNTLDDIRLGNFHNVPLLIGNTRDEGSVFIATADPEKFGFSGEKNAVVNKTYGNQAIVNILTQLNFDDPERYANYYLDNVADDDYDAIRRQTYTAVGDALILCPTVYFAESYVERKNDVYFYFFVHRPSTTRFAPWMGVVHFDEVQFVFGSPIRYPKLYESDEIELSKEMIEAWANFVKHGNSSFNWPKYSKEKHEFIYLNTSCRENEIGTGPHLNNCNIYRDHYGF